LRAASFSFWPTLESEMDFMAYCCFVSLCRTRNTFPKLPKPSYLTTSKLEAESWSFSWDDFMIFFLQIDFLKNNFIGQAD
jgi:hypothetical protein